MPDTQLSPWNDPHGLGWQVWRRAHNASVSGPRIGSLHSGPAPGNRLLSDDVFRRWGMGARPLSAAYGKPLPLVTAPRSAQRKPGTGEAGAVVSHGSAGGRLRSSFPGRPGAEARPTLPARHPVAPIQPAMPAPHPGPLHRQPVRFAETPPLVGKSPSRSSGPLADSAQPGDAFGGRIPASAAVSINPVPGRKSGRHPRMTPHFTPPPGKVMRTAAQPHLAEHLLVGYDPGPALPNGAATMGRVTATGAATPPPAGSPAPHHSGVHSRQNPARPPWVDLFRHGIPRHRSNDAGRPAALWPDGRLGVYRRPWALPGDAVARKPLGIVRWSSKRGTFPGDRRGNSGPKPLMLRNRPYSPAGAHRGQAAAMIGSPPDSATLQMLPTGANATPNGAMPLPASRAGYGPRPVRITRRSLRSGAVASTGAAIPRPISRAGYGLDPVRVAQRPLLTGEVIAPDTAIHRSEFMGAGAGRIAFSKRRERRLPGDAHALPGRPMPWRSRSDDMFTPPGIQVFSQRIQAPSAVRRAPLSIPQGTMDRGAGPGALSPTASASGKTALWGTGVSGSHWLPSASGRTGASSNRGLMLWRYPTLAHPKEPVAQGSAGYRLKSARPGPVELSHAAHSREGGIRVTAPLLPTAAVGTSATSRSLVLLWPLNGSYPTISAFAAPHLQRRLDSESTVAAGRLHDGRSRLPDVMREGPVAVGASTAKGGNGDAVPLGVTGLQRTADPAVGHDRSLGAYPVDDGSGNPVPIPGANGAGAPWGRLSSPFSPKAPLVHRLTLSGAANRPQGPAMVRSEGIRHRPVVFPVAISPSTAKGNGGGAAPFEGAGLQRRADPAVVHTGAFALQPGEDNAAQAVSVPGTNGASGTSIRLSSPFSPKVLSVHRLALSGIPDRPKAPSLPRSEGVRHRPGISPTADHPVAWRPPVGRDGGNGDGTQVIRPKRFGLPLFNPAGTLFPMQDGMATPGDAAPMADTAPSPLIRRSPVDPGNNDGGSSTGSQEAATAEGQPEGGAPTMDAEELLERLWPAIEQKLAVERERRGWTQWL